MDKDAAPRGAALDDGGDAKTLSQRARASAQEQLQAGDNHDHRDPDPEEPSYTTYEPSNY